jgi:hypothetical protein
MILKRAKRGDDIDTAVLHFLGDMNEVRIVQLRYVAMYMRRRQRT